MGTANALVIQKSAGRHSSSLWNSLESMRSLRWHGFNTTPLRHATRFCFPPSLWAIGCGRARCGMKGRALQNNAGFSGGGPGGVGSAWKPGPKTGANAGAGGGGGVRVGQCGCWLAGGLSTQLNKYKHMGTANALVIRKKCGILESMCSLLWHCFNTIPLQHATRFSFPPPLWAIGGGGTGGGGGAIVGGSGNNAFFDASSGIEFVN